MSGEKIGAATASKKESQSFFVDDYGGPEYLDGIRAQFMIYKGQMHPVAHVFREEDARLLAAAPDLLAVLTELTDGLWGNYDPKPGSMHERARAAISKATGGEE